MNIFVSFYRKDRVIEMEKEHRRIILDNISELIKLTNYDILMRKCLDRKIMFPIMKSEIEVSVWSLALSHSDKEHQCLLLWTEFKFFFFLLFF